MEIVEETRTQYEVERNKPMPSTIHSAIELSLENIFK